MPFPPFPLPFPFVLCLEVSHYGTGAVSPGVGGLQCQTGGDGEGDRLIRYMGLLHCEGKGKVLFRNGDFIYREMKYGHSDKEGNNKDLKKTMKTEIQESTHRILVSLERKRKIWVSTRKYSFKSSR